MPRRRIPDTERPSYETVVGLLKYSKATGILLWRVARNRMAAGAVAGNLDSSGHRQVKICGRRYMAHILIWFIVTGEWPENDVDHRNRKPDDNRWINLRGATMSQNKANSVYPNTCGLKGAYPHFLRDGRPSGKFSSRITINGKNKYLGLFDSAKLASAAHAAAAREAFGEFARSEAVHRAS